MSIIEEVDYGDDLSDIYSDDRRDYDSSDSGHISDTPSFHVSEAIDDFALAKQSLWGLFPHVVLLLLANLISAVTALQSGSVEITRPAGDIHPKGLEMATKKLMPFLAAKARPQNERRDFIRFHHAQDASSKLWWWLFSSIHSSWSKTHFGHILVMMKPKKMVLLEYLRGKKGAKVEGPSQEIRSEFSEFIPFAHVADRIMQGFESGMNDTQCSRLNDHIETHPPAGYEKFGRNWLRMFVRERFVKKALKKLRKHGEAVLRDEEG
ncbi:hypothetical protein FOZ62_012571 [Perkinsus olseni]|uniref:Uncharacterized protein n=1 Tax=Perkinsus olseni TaxID=32597 RepID=A0A7J6U031_PEROL|nr:hypothetical protein FOZ62_012571 [Perkinsus olseni]